MYDRTGWAKYACSTFPLNTSKVPTKRRAQDPKVVYDPARAWGDLSAYDWLKSHYTDSAAAATALATGQKSFNNALNWSDLDQPIRPTLAEAAHAAGKSAGVITTVPWSHATPAGLSNVHIAERDQYAEIARQMVEGDTMNVIMGAGNPDFDNNGQPATGRKDYKYVGGAEAWKAIEAARLSGATYRGFRPISTKAEFEALSSGLVPARVLGTAQVRDTLQQARKVKNTADPAADTPLTEGLPDLATMSRAALNVLGANPKGFYLMIEGGAVDYANHQNQAGRMIQEQEDYVRAVEAVVRWVETKSNWQETLVVLTADHETGLLWGPKSDKLAFNPVADNGPGRMPGLKYHSKGHSNSLVPLYVRGDGQEGFAATVVGKDPVRGAYVDNAGVGKLLVRAVGSAEKSR